MNGSLPSMNNLAIIPARGGSKRIPGKNIKDFLGKPIISYPIQAAIQSGLFHTIMVSTDDEEIARIARANGAEVPFMRSDKNSDDYATTADVLLEVLDQYHAMGKSFEYICCIYPTTPLLEADTLKQAYKLLSDKDFDSVIPALNYSHPIQRALAISPSDMKMEMISPEHRDTRSQDLEKRYHDAGQFYFLNTKRFLEGKRLWTDNTGAIVLDELKAQDVDSLSDWKLAELKYKLINE